MMKRKRGWSNKPKTPYYGPETIKIKTIKRIWRGSEDGKNIWELTAPGGCRIIFKEDSGLANEILKLYTTKHPKRRGKKKEKEKESWIKNYVPPKGIIQIMRNYLEKGEIDKRAINELAKEVKREAKFALQLELLAGIKDEEIRKKLNKLINIINNKIKEN